MNTETITNNSFDVFFSFPDLSKTENEILNETFISLKENQMEFELISVDKKIQPLDTLIKLKSNNSIGECIIKVKNKTDALVDLNIQDFKVSEIIGLLDFHSQNDDDKTVKIHFESSGVLYKTKDTEESL